MHALLKYNISSFFSWEIFDLAIVVSLHEYTGLLKKNN